MPPAGKSPRCDLLRIVLYPQIGVPAHLRALSRQERAETDRGSSPVGDEVRSARVVVHIRRVTPARAGMGGETLRTGGSGEKKPARPEVFVRGAPCPRKGDSAATRR